MTLEWRPLTEIQMTQEGSTLHMAFAQADTVEGSRLVMCSVWKSSGGLWVWKVTLQGEGTIHYTYCDSLDDGMARAQEFLDNWPRATSGVEPTQEGMPCGTQSGASSNGSGTTSSE